MKLQTLFLSVVMIATLIPACKKDKSVPDNNHDELLGPETSKVLHYNFNNNIDDGSGKGNNAISTQNTNFVADRFNRIGQAIYFQGESVNSNVITPNLSTEEIGFPFSVSFWFKADTIYSGETLFRADGGESSLYYGFWGQFISSNESAPGTQAIAFNFGDGTGSNSNARRTIFSPENIFNTNEWFHIVVNVSGYAPEEMEMYVNGTKVENPRIEGNAQSIVFSQNGGGIMGRHINGQKYKGALDDYRIYKKTLTQAEVNTLYNFQPE